MSKSLGHLSISCYEKKKLHDLYDVAKQILDCPPVNTSGWARCCCAWCGYDIGYEDTRKDKHSKFCLYEKLKEVVNDR
jgi:hypothetical protein